MSKDHGFDEERRVVKDESWSIFKNYIDKHHADVNTEVALKPLNLKKDPVISYGIIDFYLAKNTDGDLCAYYHMFKRRNTIEYEILLRGFFHISQLYDLLSLISQDERKRILENPWEDLWDDLWIDHDYPSYSSLKSQSKRKFPQIKEVLSLLDETLVCKIPERSFIFPKGKAEKGESGWETALREAKEETGNSYQNGYLYFNSPIVQHFIGSDNNPYTDCYYVWKSDGYYKTQEFELDDKTSPRARLRNHSISAELESDVWIEIPIFKTNSERLEWINSIDPYRSFNVFHRHFSAIMEIHSHLSTR